jgi:hypothetical protein
MYPTLHDRLLCDGIEAETDDRYLAVDTTYRTIPQFCVHCAPLPSDASYELDIDASFEARGSMGVLL